MRARSQTNTNDRGVFHPSAYLRKQTEGFQVEGVAASVARLSRFVLGPVGCAAAFSVTTLSDETYLGSAPFSPRHVGEWPQVFLILVLSRTAPPACGAFGGRRDRRITLKYRFWAGTAAFA